LQAWKSRWFVLFEGSTSLLYFKDEAAFHAGLVFFSWRNSPVVVRSTVWFFLFSFFFF
jgi:hypothetical protein